MTSKQSRRITLATYATWQVVAQLEGYCFTQGPRRGNGNVGALMDALANGEVAANEIGRLLREIRAGK